MTSPDTPAAGDDTAAGTVPAGADEAPLTRAEAENLAAEAMSSVVPLRSRAADAQDRPQLDPTEWTAHEYPGLGWAFLPTGPDRALGMVVSQSRRVEWFVATDDTPESCFARVAHLDAVDQDPPYSPSAVCAWLTDLIPDQRPDRRSGDDPTSDDLALLRDALLATLEALGKDNLFSWGPAPGSRAEGEYERAHQTFYALERPLRQRMRADGVER